MIEDLVGRAVERRREVRDQIREQRREWRDQRREWRGGTWRDPDDD